MKKENKKVKISNILLLALSIVAILIIILIAIEFSKRNENEEKVKEVISQVNENIEKNENKEIPYIEFQGYQVIGTIKIPKINIEYPILISSTKESLKKSISRFGEGKVNEIGNLCLAGHNYIDGSMFGKINQLENGDEISILDLYGNEVTYTVFNKYITNPNDSKVLESINKDKKEVTLITCINGNKDRLIIRANEK